MRATVKRKFVFALSLMIFTPLALALEGHDHSHWSSFLVHGLFLLAMAGGGLVFVIAIYSALNRFEAFKQ